MAARCSRDSWEDGAGVAAQALAIQDRATELARADADAWESALRELARAERGEEDSAGELERTLARAAAVPLEIAELGADAAVLAALAAELCDGAYRADAAAAAALSAGGARAAAHLVEVNLAVREGDERLVKARASEAAAGDAAQRVLDFIR